ncbi:MAG: sulfotransferase [Pedosphaera sp.]|nr:sulfotransferase [Pedosphaera sp.]
MQDDDRSDCKYVFVCGLPRSGTSVLGRNIARLENSTGFKNTGVLEDEGKFLQDVYPSGYEDSGAGRFGFDPRNHRTETSDLFTAENVVKLRASWHSHWDKTKLICVEKTPENLLMTRFLQAVFPNSYFIVVRRHPVPVGMAGQRWKVNVTSLYRMFEHWLHCHELFEQDKKHLKHVYELKYEDYVEHPDRYHLEIAAFIGSRVPEPPKEDTFRYVAQWRNPVGLRVPEGAMEDVSGAHNKKYLDRWANLLRNSFFKRYYRHIARKYEPRFAKYGYSLTTGLGLDEEVLRAEGSLSAALGALCCLGADGYALMWRLCVRSKAHIKKRIKAMLPEFVLTKIKQVRQRASLDRGRVGVDSPHG